MNKEINGTELSPETESHVYSQLIFNKVPKQLKGERKVNKHYWKTYTSMWEKN